MTTTDVITTLLAHGWRWEAIEPGLAPCLTNAPEGQIFCIHCGDWQPREGKNAQACKYCAYRQQRMSLAKNPEYYRGYRRGAYLRHRAKRLAYQRRYHQTHKARISAKRKAWYAAQKTTRTTAPVSRKAYYRKYRATHREQINAAQRARRAAQRKEPQP